MMDLQQLATPSGATTLVGVALAVAVTLVVVSSLGQYFSLSHIPGPLVAKFSNLQRFLWVASDEAHEHHVAAHRRYGDIVRFGPNMVSVGDPNEISKVYTFTKPWLKSDFYNALLMKPQGKPVPGIFATQDEDIHKMLKRPVAGAYAMSTLVGFEPYVDTTMKVFCEQLEQRFASASKESPGQICDLGQWLQMFAFDVIGELTFSKRLGFLETGQDLDEVMISIWNVFKTTSLITQMPWLDGIWTNNPVHRWLYGVKPQPAGKFAMARVQERRQLSEEKLREDMAGRNRDFLTLFLDIERNNATLPPYALPSWAASNITAGSDTTGIFLKTIMYHLHAFPDTLQTLRAELDAAATQGKLGALVSWKESRELPYLDAVIKEAGRIHPPFGLPFERVVPEGGVTICGKDIPGGTVVGMSPFVVHRNKALFGEDCDSWNPSRWIGCTEEKRRRMENALIYFGAGHRSCMGKHIAYLEMFKVVPTLVRQFDFELVGPEEGGGWHVQNRWFVMQSGLLVRLKKRASAPSIE